MQQQQQQQQSTGQCWQHLPPPPPPASQYPPLPPGWVKTTDPVSGHAYYANATTGQTSWEPPSFPPPPPPPPPPPSFPPPPAPPAAVVQSYSSTATPMVQPPMATATHSAAQTVVAPVVTGAMMLGVASAPAAPSNMLVPGVRALVNADYTERALRGQGQQVDDDGGKIELEGLSAGTIADLCNVARDVRQQGCSVQDGGSTDEEEDAVTPYVPLRPFELPVTSRAPHIEPGRVDIRIMSLYDKLGRI